MTNRKTLFAALAALALLASPALAGGGNGHGNGGGNAGGNGGGNGNAGGNGNGKSGASHGKSASARGKVAKAETDTTTDITVNTKSVPKDKNIHAKLGRLNSLQRNINAYMNSKSKKFAAIQAFVTQSAIAQNAEAAAAAADATAEAAQAELDGLKADLTKLQADPSATTAQIQALNDQITAQQDVVDAADTKAAQAEADAKAATVGTDPASLNAALTEMANKPVDAEVTTWAEGVLADKIDQAAAALQAEATP